MSDECQDNFFQELGQTYRAHGSTAVADKIALEVEQPERAKIYQAIPAGVELEIVCHPNEEKAIAWMNERFRRMGLGALKFVPRWNPAERDPTAVDEESLRLTKYLRFFFGPGIALIATILSRAQEADLGSGILPAITIGAMTVLLEMQFAWPWFNNLVWKRVFKFGGELFSPITMWLVNFVYLLILYATGFVTVHFPEIFGGSAIAFNLPPFRAALSDALYWSLLYTLALGIFQSDVACEEARGSITSNQWYRLETTGLVIINTSRVLKWVLPGSDLWTYYSLAAFFLLKTFPQLLKTHLADRLADREIFRVVDPKRAPKAGLLESLARRVGESSFVNLPRLIKEKPLAKPPQD